ncbi:DnaJ domain-containing protein [Rhizobium sp. KVB221]|uniref:DnaJ domain-containing protein n=1 Tax=Rhizobium setariae TaxID=2801340 RepID=A0A936YIH1_9HYPH|nr:DnaJ C-terminal domain-containing protein [Rhizobium setariae]MBL0370810.1 DnaJ domain-containing protein [Rhizobium setariae]
MRDPYSILGVNKDAGQQEIKAAWRATAKALHPDQNPDDPRAVNRFTEAGRAYDLLKDPDKRRLFDEARARATTRGNKEATFMEQRAERARAEAEAKAAAQARAQAEARAAAAAAAVSARASGGETAGKESAEDVVSKIFGTRKTSEKAESPAQQAQRPQAEAARANAQPAYEELDPASTEKPSETSAEQRTSPALELMSYLLKRLTRQIPPPDKVPDLIVDVAVSIEDILNRLNPAITLPDGKLLSITLPESIKDGTEVRIEGYGHRLQGLKRGDVVARIKVKPHRWYRTDEHDLRTFADIDIDKAVLGGEATVETIDGPIAITIPAWSGSQYTTRIAGRGLPKGAGSRGDLVVEARVMLWDRPDQKLVDLMQSLRNGLYL